MQFYIILLPEPAVQRHDEEPPILELSDALRGALHIAGPLVDFFTVLFGTQPVERRGRGKWLQFHVVGPEGLEPSANGLKVRYSTN